MKKIISSTILVFGLAVMAWALVLVTTDTASAAPALTPAASQSGKGDDAPNDCGYVWHQVPSPNQGQDTNFLSAIAAGSGSNIWAVGAFKNGTSNSTLTERWNGTSWSIVPSPNIGDGDNMLLGVTMISDNDVWAVGEAFVIPYWHTLVEHWNGSNWTVVSTPDLNTDSVFSGVSAVTSNNIYAVGSRTDADGHDQTLIEHWNGSVWATVASPNRAGPNVLFDVAALSSNAVWAVGISYEASGEHTLIEYWNGVVWSIVNSPNPGQISSRLASVSVTASNDAWVVGTYYSGGATQTLTAHWNGASWIYVPSPSPGTQENFITGVSELNANDVWAVGYYINPVNVRYPLTEHWNGSAWTVASNLASDVDSLAAVTMLDSGNVWAVGATTDTKTLVERYSLTCYTPTATSTATPGGATSTATRTATRTSTATRTATATGTATSTPTATGTSCPIQFTDVVQGSTYYDYVRCMACRGIISGYNSGCETGNPCFRPNSDVTRGQLSKIVANAANLSNVGPSQLFQDVPQGSTFYDFIQSLSNAGVISGYACGGLGEPCVAPNNLPYFRPNSSATRGQITKIVSIAAGFNDAPSGQQFQDIAVGSTYYAYAYRLVTRSIMSGYVCGGPGEPCVAPDNLPYFRPNSNATRGQTSKIVSNTFFPNCQTP